MCIYVFHYAFVCRICYYRESLLLLLVSDPLLEVSPLRLVSEVTDPVPPDPIVLPDVSFAEPVPTVLESEVEEPSALV